MTNRIDSVNVSPRSMGVPPGRASRRAFLLIDAVFALTMLVILAIALAATMAYQHRALVKLADARAATRLAERTLMALQITPMAPPAQAVNPALSEGAVTLSPLAIPAPPGYAWVDVVATVGASKSHLTGLVPAKAGGQP